MKNSRQVHIYIYSQERGKTVRALSIKRPKERKELCEIDPCQTSSATYRLPYKENLFSLSFFYFYFAKGYYSGAVLQADVDERFRSFYEGNRVPRYKRTLFL